MKYFVFSILTLILSCNKEVTNPSFEKIKDIDTIFSLSTKPPLLYVNGELRSEGKYLSVEECKELLSKIIQEQK